jgi:regulator of replication initiation timing
MTLDFDVMIERLLNRREQDQSILTEMERLRTELGQYKKMYEDTYSVVQDLAKQNQELGKENEDLWVLVEKSIKRDSEAEKKKKEELEAKEKSKYQPYFPDNYSPQPMDLGLRENRNAYVNLIDGMIVNENNTLVGYSASVPTLLDVKKK